MAQHTVDEFSALVGAVYDAALDENLWLGVLERTARFVDGATAGLLSKDSISKQGEVHHSFGVDERFLGLYRDTYWRYDPISPLLFSAVGEVTARDDFVADAEFLEGRFYREWAKPQGWIDAANVVLDRSPSGFALLSVIRSEVQGKVDAAMRERVALLAPHLRRAVLIGRVVDLERGRAENLGSVFDSLSAGVFLLDDGDRIIHANRSGLEMADAGEPVRIVKGRLLARSGDASRELGIALAAARRGDMALGQLGIALPLPTSDGRIFVAHILPMRGGGLRRRAAGSNAETAVFLRPAELDQPVASRVIADTYGLTPAELRVLLQIVESRGVADTADALGISAATVKTHLQRLFAKTGVSRQADLVRLVAGFSTSLIVAAPNR